MFAHPHIHTHTSHSRSNWKRYDKTCFLIQTKFRFDFGEIRHRNQKKKIEGEEIPPLIPVALNLFALNGEKWWCFSIFFLASLTLSLPVSRHFTFVCREKTFFFLFNAFIIIKSKTNTYKSWNIYIYMFSTGISSSVALILVFFTPISLSTGKTIGQR